MGKWLKLTDNSNNTVCLKYVPGMDRFIDHGIDRTTWALPLLRAVNLASTSGTGANIEYNRIVEPSESSLREYAAALSRPSNATLNVPNNDMRFISFTPSLTNGDPAQSFTKNFAYSQVGSHSWRSDGPFFNLVDAYTFVDAYIVGLDVFGFVNYSVVAVAQVPDQVYSLPVNNALATRWRRPFTTALEFKMSTSESDGYPILDCVYDQLVELFGPF